MTKIVLDRIELSNFKGIKHFVLDAGGSNIRVYGDNATGKTTIVDSFTWLLSDKDSSGSNKFQLKPVDEKGNDRHYLDTAVTASLIVNGQPMELKKVYHEIWSTKRGESVKEFNGHTSDCSVDGVPTGKKEFENTINGLLEIGGMKGKKAAQLFKCLTLPLYFSSQNWKVQRDILVDVCGNYTDEEIMAKNDNLADLPNILGRHTIEQYQKIIDRSFKDIKEEKKKVPIQIGENTRLKNECTSQQSEKSLRDSAENLQKKISLIEDKIRRIQSGGEIDVKRNEIRKIEGQRLDLRNSFQTDIHKEIDQKQSEYYDLKGTVDSESRKLRDLKDQVIYWSQKVAKLEEKRKDLRQDWFSEGKKKFDFSGETTCPTCGQELPEDQIQEAIDKAREQFNLAKAEAKADIHECGMQAKEDSERYQSEIKSANDEIAKIESRISAEKADLEVLNKQVDDLKSGVKNIIDDPRFQKLQKTEKDIELEIHRLQTSADDEAMAENKKKSDLKKQLTSVETELGKYDRIRDLDERIAELDQREKDLAKQEEQLDYQKHLIEQFNRTKVNMLESRINSRFKLAKFKLFEDQINGGLNPTCEVTYGGVPYNALNNAARINVGLDIINTLADHYEFSAPIFVDNREAVTHLIDVDAQVVSLIVSEKDKVLRVENEESKAEEVI